MTHTVSLSRKQYFLVNLAGVLEHLGLALMIGGMLALVHLLRPFCLSMCLVCMLVKP